MLHFCMNWTPATPIGPRDAPFSSRSIPLSPSIATHTQSSLCDAKCASATSFLSDASALFHFPYPVSPVFATHTKTAGCVPTIPNLELCAARSPDATQPTLVAPPIGSSTPRTSRTSVISALAADGASPDRVGILIPFPTSDFQLLTVNFQPPDPVS